MISFQIIYLELQIHKFVLHKVVLHGFVNWANVGIAYFLLSLRLEWNDYN